MKTEITVKIVVEHTTETGLKYAKEHLKVDKKSDARGGNSFGRWRVEDMQITEKKLED